MPSSSKTANLGLNRFSGTDKPKMDDFNFDNERLDQQVGSHLLNEVIHLTAEEKESLKTGHFAIGTYQGSGVPKREIPLEFKPLFGILFAVDQALSLPDMADSSLGVLCGGFFTPDGGTYGLEMKGNSLVVYQSMNSSGPVTMHHNILNVQYIYLLVR